MKNSRRYLTVVLGLALGVSLLMGCSKQARTDRSLSRANHVFELEQYDQAEIEYLNALKLSPGNPTAIGRLGLIYHAEGRLLAAFSVLKKAAELDPKNLEVRLKLASSFLALRQLKNARDQAELVLQQQPANEEALLLMADTSTNTVQIQQVRKMIEGLPAATKDTAGCHLVFGSLFLRAQNLAQAEGEFKLALARDPKSSAAHLALGNIHLQRNEPKLAEPELKAAAEVAPLRSAQRFPYAQLLLLQGNVAEARKLVQPVTEKAPDYVPAWVFLAQIAFSERKVEECSELVQKVLARDSGNYDALLLKGSLMLAQGDRTNAVAHFERMADSMYGQVPQVQYDLALAQLMNSATNKGMTSLNKAINLNTNYTQASLLLAELNLRKRNFAPAIISLTQLIKQAPDMSRAYLLLADAYLAQKNPSAALSVYDQMISRFPEDPQIRIFRGELLAQQQQRPAARKDFEKALELAPKLIPALEKLVDMDLLDKRYTNALQRIQKAMEQKPDSPNPWLLQAKVYMAQNDLGRAEAALLKANEKDPNIQMPYIQLARIYVDSKQFPQALQRLNELVEKHTNNISALLQIGMIQDELKNYDAAREAYEKLLRVNPRYVPALNNLAYLYAERFAQPEKALDLASQARSLAPDDPSTADTLGWILYRKREYPRALALFQESTGKLPNRPEIQFHLGMAHYMMGEADPARLHLQRALQAAQEFPGKPECQQRLAMLSADPATADAATLVSLEQRVQKSPDDPIAFAFLAAVYERNGTLDKAVASYEQALKLTPNNAQTTGRLAVLYGRLNNPGKALEMAKAAHSLAPDDARISYILGRLVFQSGDHKWAANLISESARKFPQDSAILYDLAWSQYSLGQVSEAVATMQKALQAGLPASQAVAANRFLSLVKATANATAMNAADTQAQTTLKENPNDVPALMVIAGIQEHAEKYQEAAKLYDQVLARYPQFMPAARQLAILCVEQLGNAQRGLDLATKARAAFPEDAGLAKALGMIAFRQGNFSRSRQLLSESAAKRNDDAELFYYLGMSHYQLKERNTCKQALQRALTLRLSPKLTQEANRVLAEFR